MPADTKTRIDVKDGPPMIDSERAQKNGGFRFSKFLLLNCSQKGAHGYGRRLQRKKVG